MVHPFYKRGIRMYIAPNTTIKLLHNVPLDPSYDHTIYFGSKGDQSSYFSSKAKYSFSNQSYQRVNKNTIKLQVEADNIYDCNYVMFQNSSFGSKWFYAFIKRIDYINNDVSEIEYEIDDIQTWFFDFSFVRTFVDREHSETDIIGENILPEPVQFGEYYHDPDSWEALTSHDFYYIVAICDVGSMSSPSAINGKVYNNLYGGCTLYCYKNNTSGETAMNSRLSQHIADPNAVVSIYTVPS